MQYISTTDARAAFSDILSKVQKEPVVIQRQNKDVAVIISPEAYEKLRRINTAELNALCARASTYARKQGLTKAKLAKLLSD